MKLRAVILMVALATVCGGRLWAVSESGTRKYRRWGDQFHFPFVFEIDVAKLK